MGRYTVPFGGVEKVCKVCKRSFTVLEPMAWGFKDGDTYYCSDSCQRKVWPKVDKRILAELEGRLYTPEGTKNREYRYISSDVKKRCLELRRLGFSSNQIAEQTGISKTSVCDICKKAGMPFHHIRGVKKDDYRAVNQ